MTPIRSWHRWFDMTPRHRFRFLVLLSAVALPAAATVLHEPQLNVRITAATLRQAVTVRSAAILASHAVDELFGHGVSRHRLPESTLSVVPEWSHTADASPLLLQIPDDASWAEIVHRVNGHFLVRRLTYETGRAVHPGSVHWLAAAASHAVLHRRGSSEFSLAPNYQPLRNMLRDGRLPTPENLVQRPVAPVWGPLYTLYAMNCRLLADILRTHRSEDSGNALHALALLLAGGEPVRQAFETILQPRLQQDQSVDQWYREQADLHARRGRRALAADQVVARVHQALHIGILMPGDRDQLSYQRFNLHDALQMLGDYRVTAQFAASRKLHLHEILKDAPLVMQDAVADHILALDGFARHGSRRRLQRELLQAEKALLAAADRQRRIDAYLDDIQRSVLAYGRTLETYLPIIQGETRKKQQLAPRIHRYLDSIAK